MMDENLDLWFIEANARPLVEGWTPERNNYFNQMLVDSFEIVFGLLRSRTKRVINYVNYLTQMTDAWGYKDGGIEVSNLDQRRAEFRELSKNRFEPEFEPSARNGFQKIIDENYANPNPSASSIVQFLIKERSDKKYTPDEVGETLHGGVYSVGSAIVSILHCLAQNRTYLHRLEKELREKLGSGRDYSHEQLKSISFLEAVLRESIRLLPPVSFYSRKALTDCVLNGVDVPKDSAILVSTWQSHHDDKFWKDPFVFNPDRWLQTPDFLEQNTYGSDNFCPFGRGLRQCMGYPYGLLNMKVVVVEFVLHTDFTTFADTWEDNFFFGINMPYSFRAKVERKH
jgi:cytochrome P450